MRISIIAAMSRDFLIGTEGGLPWRLPDDLKRFRKLTIGKPVIVGRKTLEILGAPLKGRPHIVLTHKPDFQYPGCQVAHGIVDALQQATRLLPELGVEEVMIIGGAEVYRAAEPFVDRMYLTMVEGEFTGATFFPESCRPGSEWRRTRVEAFAPDERNPFAQQFEIWDRVRATDENPVPTIRG